MTAPVSGVEKAPLGVGALNRWRRGGAGLAAPAPSVASKLVAFAGAGGAAGLPPLPGAEPLVCRSVQVAATPRGPVLAQVDAQFAAGRVTAILGPNGAGKSTLLACLSAGHAPRSGQVLLGATPLAQCPPAQRALRLALMHQDTHLAFAFTVQEVVEMGRYPHRTRPSLDEAGIVQRALKATGVEALAQREVSSLSGGERARVHLARALAQMEAGPCAPAGQGARPVGPSRWLLLDEPTAALDLMHQNQAMALVRDCAEQSALGVVVVLHDLNLALRYAHDVLLVPGGGQPAVLGTAHEVLTLETIARVWQVQGELQTTRDGTPHFVVSGAALGGAAQSGAGRADGEAGDLVR